MDEIVTMLESVSERLADRSLELLSDAVRTGATVRPGEEKIVTQARRAVEKALHLLRPLAASASDDESDC